MRAVIATRVFTGEAMLTDHAVLIEAGRIADVVPAGGIDGERLPEDVILAPGFIDAQANGGGGVLFNDTPDMPTLRRMAAAHRRFGTTSLLPTLITDTEDRLRAAVACVAAAMAAGEPGIAGLHLEGPFISVARRGVHRADLVRAMRPDDVAYLCEHTPRPLLLTLAPETVSHDTITRLAEAGIVVSIGHTEATYEQARAALAAGARGFTHLFNAMPPPGGRAPGPVFAALDDRQSYAGMIVDGHHVHPASLRVALGALTPARAVLVTDAMASVGSDISGFDLQGRRITVADARLTAADGTLAGAHLDMASAVRNTVGMLGTTLSDALRMASAAPADFLGIAEARGRLRPGCFADMVALTDAVDISGVWIAGRPALVGSESPC
jgi:N-acetylglucosamine-6-phosphate deacetylase